LDLHGKETMHPFSLREMITDTVVSMGLPDGIVEFEWADDMPDAFADAAARWSRFLIFDQELMGGNVRRPMNRKSL